MSTKAAASRLFTASAVCALVAACGGGAPPAKEPREPDVPRTPTTVEEAEEQIARAKAELEGEPRAKTEADGLSAAPPPPPPAAESRTAEPSPTGERAEPACASPCRAIASMRRAVEALCRLAGESDDRCAGAKRTLEGSEARVAACKC